MRLVISPVSKISEIVATEILNTIKDNPKSILGLSTGGTMTPIYKYIYSNYKKHKISFKEVKTFNLDEYVGLSEYDLQSYHYYMKKHFISKVDILPNNVYIPDGSDDRDTINKYNNLLDQNPIDLLILGLGMNGHIGFNEPGCDFDKRTHLQVLALETRNANRRFFNSLAEVPTHAITMGIKDMLKAKKIIVVATGVRKQLAVWNMFNEKENNNCPATVLNRHNNVTVYVDDNAAQLIQVKS